MVTDTASIDAPEAAAPRPAQHSAALGAPSVNLLGDLHALAVMGEHLARSMKGVFEPLFRRTAKVSAEPIKISRFEDYAEARGPKLASWTPLSMTPLQGHALLVIDGGAVLEAVDLFFGGAGVAPQTLPAEFTPVAEAMVRRIADGVATRMKTAWAPLSPIACTQGSTEANPAMLGGIDGDDRIVVTRFQLQISDTRRTTVDILYPVTSLKPIAPALCAKVAGKRSDGDPAWLSGLTRAVMNVPLPVRSVLAEPVIPLQTLLNLKPGDIIPITLGPEVPLIVATERFATGAVGAANGHAAIRVHRIVTPQEDQR